MERTFSLPFRYPSSILPVSFRRAGKVAMRFRDSLNGHLLPFRYPSGILPVSFRRAGKMIVSQFSAHGIRPGAVPIMPLVASVWIRQISPPAPQIIKIRWNPSGILPAGRCSGPASVSRFRRGAVAVKLGPTSEHGRGKTPPSFTPTDLGGNSICEGGRTNRKGTIRGEVKESYRTLVGSEKRWG